jgi:hypothetical protein
MDQYADEIRTQLRAVGRTVKQNRKALKIVMSHLAELRDVLYGNCGFGCRAFSPCPSLEELVPRIFTSRKKATTLQLSIQQDQEIQSDLQQSLKTAPKRLRVRSKVASIAASGSRAIGVAAGGPRPCDPLVAWEDGLYAAKATALKYGMVVPEPSLTLMEERWRTYYPSWILLLEYGDCRVVALVKRVTPAK